MALHIPDELAVNFNRLSAVSIFRVGNRNLVDNLCLILSEQEAVQVFHGDSRAGQFQRMNQYFPLNWMGICITLPILFISCQRAHPQNKLLQKWIFRRLGKFFQSADFFKRTGKIVPHIVRNDLPLQLRNLKLLRPHQNLAAILWNTKALQKCLQNIIGRFLFAAFNPR